MVEVGGEVLAAPFRRGSDSHNDVPRAAGTPPMSPDSPPFRMLRLPEVKALTGLSRTTIYELIARCQFPSPVKLGCRSVAWLEEEVLEWRRERIALSRGYRAIRRR